LGDLEGYYDEKGNSPASGIVETTSSFMNMMCYNAPAFSECFGDRLLEFKAPIVQDLEHIVRLLGF